MSTSSVSNEKWTLQSRPEGFFSASKNSTKVTEEIDLSSLAEEEIIVKAGKELSAMLTRLQEPILLMARLMAAWAKTPLRLIFEKVIFITLGAATLGTKVRARAGI